MHGTIQDLQTNESKLFASAPKQFPQAPGLLAIMLASASYKTSLRPECWRKKKKKSPVYRDDADHSDDAE